MAEDILRKAHGTTGPSINVRPIAGNIDGLLIILNELIGLLEQVREAQINQEIKQRVAAATVKKAKRHR
jgi:hypothetical protein